MCSRQKCLIHVVKKKSCVTLQEHTKEELDRWKIVRVSEDFWVIALGLPVSKYKGNPLDPPLRSRFQARDIYYLPFKVRSKSPDRLALNLSHSVLIKLGCKSVCFWTFLCVLSHDISHVYVFRISWSCCTQLVQMLRQKGKKIKTFYMFTLVQHFVFLSSDSTLFLIVLL